MSEVRIHADLRTEPGTSGARATRREGKVPGIVYGHGEDPVMVALPARELGHALRGGRGVLLRLSLGHKRLLVLPKEVQRHPLQDTIEHIDLLLVRKGEKVTVDVPLHLVGAPVSGGIVNQNVTSVSLEVEATSIPTALDLDIEGLDVGGQRTLGDVVLPAGATVHGDPDEVVVSVLAPVSESAEAETAASEATGAEASAAE